MKVKLAYRVQILDSSRNLLVTLEFGQFTQPKSLKTKHYKFSVQNSAVKLWKLN